MKKNMIVFMVFYAIFLSFFSCQRSSEDMNKFQSFVEKFKKNNEIVRNQTLELNKILKDVVEQYPDSLNFLLKNLDTTLTAEQMQVLEELIQQEKDASLKAQLNRIVELKRDLNNARNELEQLRQVLPMPVRVKKGQNHYQICLNYLMKNHQLSKKEARDLVEKAALIDPLVEGFYVWNYYKDGVFGSFVTQGEALISPMDAYRRDKAMIKQKIETERAKRDSALLLADELKQIQMKLSGELQEAQKDVEITRKRLDSLKQVQDNLNRRLNSVNYFVDLEKTLKSSDFLHGGFLRKTKIKAFPPEDQFMMLDLRSENSIELISTAYGINKFKKIIIYPKEFQMDIDYELKYNAAKDSVQIIIKKPEKFQQKRILIAIK